MSQRKALTLVELLVTVAIMGLLLGIAVPNVMTARGAAQENACQGNMVMIEAAIEQWALDTNQASGIDIAANQANWDDYLRNGSLPACPSAGVYAYNGNGTAGTLGNYKITCGTHGDVE